MILPTGFNEYRPMPLTVSEIADRIVKGSAAKRALIRRLRHWTKEGLLKPTGKKHPGTGSHHTYEDWAIEDAALLNAMADFGLPIDTMWKALVQAQSTRSEWGRGKTAQGKRFFISIYFPPDIPPYLHHGEGNPLDHKFETMIVFDLARLFARLKPEGNDNGKY
jgi:DNA-binding transcriptional MerR regulator